MKKQTCGFTLIELLIVIAIIGILAAIAVPMYQMKLYRARLTEVTNSMSAAASAVAHYYLENGTWPQEDLTTASAIQNTLGISVPINSKYLERLTVGGGTGIITGDPQNMGDSRLDNNTLSLIPSRTQEGAITWRWSGSSGFPEDLIPKK